MDNDQVQNTATNGSNKLLERTEFSQGEVAEQIGTPAQIADGGMTPAQLLKPVGTDGQVSKEDPSVTAEHLAHIQKDMHQELSRSAEVVDAEYDHLKKERKLVNIKRRSSQGGRRSSELRNVTDQHHRTDTQDEVSVIRGAKMRPIQNVQIASQAVSGSMRSHTTVAMKVDSQGEATQDQDRFDRAYMDRVLGLGDQSHRRQMSTIQPNLNQGVTNREQYATLDTQQALHGRHQSVDQRAMGYQSGERGSFIPGMHEVSNISGIESKEQSALIEEVRKNNLPKVSKLMDQFIVSKANSGTITGRRSQQRKRDLKNSYMAMSKQRATTLDRSSTKHTDITAEYPGAVGPKYQIGVPKSFIMNQIAKQIDADALEQIVSKSNIGAQSYLGNKQGQDKSFLEFTDHGIEGVVDHPAAAQSQFLKGNQQRSPFKNQSKSFRTIDANPTSILDIVNNQALAEHSTSFRDFNNSSLKSGLVDPSQSILQQNGLNASPSPNLASFHITDLLEKSIMINAREREQNKLRQIIDFYKRSVKDQKDISSKKEIMIKNYRLYVIKDADTEIDEEQRKFYTLNKGTSIHVSNSIIRPDIQKFSTQVSDQITDVYPFLKEDLSAMKKKAKRRLGSARRRSDFVIDEYDEMERLSALEERRDRMNQTMQFQAEAETALDSNDIMEEPDDGVSSRPFTAASAGEMEAIRQTNRIFDKWLREIMSANSAALARPRRYILQNGQPSSIATKEINWEIAVKHGTLLKEKPLPLTRFTEQSFYTNAPYRHLQMLVVNQDIRDWYSKFILKTTKVQTHKQIVSTELQTLNFQDSKIAVDFGRHHLTHLDPLVFKDDNLQIELFYDFGKYIKKEIQRLNELREINELRDDKDKIGIECRTFYLMRDGSKQIIDCQIMAYDPKKARFFVRSVELGVSTWRSRLYIQIEGDNMEEMLYEREAVKDRRKATVQYMRVHRLINDELLKRYDYIKLNDDVRMAIQARLACDILRYNPDSVRKLIMQIEALYVFAILKSTLSSQRKDPWIREILQRFKIDEDSPALEYPKTDHMEKEHLPGIEEYNMKGIKVELNHNSLLLMDEKYIKMPIFLNSLTWKCIGANKLFRQPFDIAQLMAQNSKEFRKLRKHEIDRMINQFPLHHDKFVAAQSIMANYFHRVAKFKWAETIQKELWSYVQNDFNFEMGVELEEENIDPVLLRLFYQLKLYMQTVMFEHMESGLRDYLNFILGFILRDTELEEKKDNAPNNRLIEELKYDKYIRLGYEPAKQFYQPKEIINDIDLIPKRTKPMILIDTAIEDMEVINKNTKKQVVVTKPELSKVSEDLSAIIDTMHTAIEEVDRVDALIFPLLELEEPFLRVPVVRKDSDSGDALDDGNEDEGDEKLCRYVEMIDKLITSSLKSTRQKVEYVKGYMTIFEKRTDNIITELKIKSFNLAQDMFDDDDKTKEDGAEEEEKTSKESEEEDSDDYNEEEDEEGDGQKKQGNEMAYKSQEINDDLMKEEIFGLREQVWKVMFNIHNQYDFGMVYLDCVKFKDRILGHINGLIHHLESYVKSEFTTKQKNIQKEIKSVKGELDKKAETIDEVINLLQYIDTLDKQDNQIEDISMMIRDLAKRMDYIESVKIRFPDRQYAEFLQIRNWPNTFRKYIVERKQELMAQKDKLKADMEKQILEIKDTIQQFKSDIDDIVLKEGLEEDTREDLDSEEPEEIDLGNGEVRSVNSEDRRGWAEEKEKKRWDPKGKTFDWLVEQVKFFGLLFNKDNIKATFQRIQLIKNNYDAADKECNLINKREALLHSKKTDFKDLAVINDDLKPLFALWTVADSFAKTMPNWVEDRFDKLDAAKIETQVEDWVNELKRLKKTELYQKPPRKNPDLPDKDPCNKQQELLDFMFLSLDHFKKYGPMIRTLRTKGLASRHWRDINNVLSQQNLLEKSIDPSNIQLYVLILLELYKPEKMEKIKEISEIATKEYAVQMSLETLEKEMKAVEFTFQNSPSPAGISEFDTYVIAKLPETIVQFEEFMLRAGVLRSNPHIKNFQEKLMEIEKILKTVVEQINEWQVFQRNFIYLNSIFCQEEIRNQLASDAKTFTQVQQLYITTIAGFKEQPQIYLLYKRENFLAQLMKHNSDCDHIRQGLMEFLEKKRGKFPRLFFLSNEELIDIFGKGPMLVETLIEDPSRSFIQNIFEGIDYIVFNEGLDITHMISRDGEEVHLYREVMTRNIAVDTWLKYLEQRMKESVKNQVFLTFEAMDKEEVPDLVNNWCGQALYLCSQIWYTMRVNCIHEAVQEAEKYSRPIKAAGGEGSRQGTAESNVRSQAEKTESEAPEEKEEEVDEFAEKVEEEDPEVVDQRNFLAKIKRDIAQWENTDPDRATLEKITGINRRFRVNKDKLPGVQLEKISNDIQTIIMQLTVAVKQRLSGSVRAAVNALLTGYVHLRDVNSEMIKQKVYRPETFAWQMQFKFNFEDLIPVVEKETNNSNPRFRQLETHKLDVNCEVFGNVRPYGFEYLGNCQRLVVTPLTERCQRSLLIALQYNYGGAPEGPFGTGKTETTKDLGRQFAKMSFVLNSSASYEYNGVVRFFKGLATSGAWVVFDEFNRMDPNVLSLISQVIITIQNAIRTQSPHVIFDTDKMDMKPDCAVFITLNPGYAGRAELPINLKALFRPISMVVPDSIFITEILLLSAGFLGASQLARKIVQMQALANVVMSKSEVAHDFGLRSIKAIVSIAESLKLNAQGITDCPLTEMIDDMTLESVPYKSDVLMKEVMNETQAKINQFTKDQAGSISGSPNKLKKKGTKVDSALDHIPEEGGSPQRNASPDRAKNDSKLSKNASPDRGKNESKLSLQKRGNTEEETDKEEEEDPNKKGHFYTKIWGEEPYSERQRRIVYKQIGIDPDLIYKEEELEEYIVLKAVRDYNHSKFAATEHLLIEGTIKDIFQGCVPDLDQPLQDYGKLKSAIHQSFEMLKIDYSAPLRTKALQFFEIQRNKHGVIIVGKPQAGKTTLVQLLENALNKCARNEYMLAVQDKRRERLLQRATKYEKDQMQRSISALANQKTGKTSGLSGGQGAKKKNKKADKANEAKKLLEKWQEMFKKTKLTHAELVQIRNNLCTKGVNMRRLNPKGMTNGELIGAFDKDSHEWYNGMFTSHFKEFASIRDDKKKWILLDGPIDYIWVENLNSILDDNKRMSLPNGESIKMSEGMTILLETDKMHNVTPATVSRCGLVVLERDETCSSKALFNQFLRNLPPNISEYTNEMEAVANYLMPQCIKIFKEEKKAGKLRFSSVNMHWLIQSFVRILYSMISDYYVDHEKSMAKEAMNKKGPGEGFGQSLFNMTLGNRWVDLVGDPNETIWIEEAETPLASPAPEMKTGMGDALNSKTGSMGLGSANPSRTHSQASQRKVAMPDKKAIELERNKREPNTCFIETEIRYENALKFTGIWMESFVLYAMVWTFHPVLSDDGRKRLDKALYEKYDAQKTSYSDYQREKKRKMAEKQKEEKEKKSQATKSSKGGDGEKKTISHSKSMITSEHTTSQAPTASKQEQGEILPNNDGLTADWNDELDEKPMLISDYPEDYSFYDCYFSQDTNGWKPFNIEEEMANAKIAYNDMVGSTKRMHNFFCPSAESIRHQYLLEICVSNQIPLLVVGNVGSGASTFIRENIFTRVFDYTKALQVDHITLTSHTDSTMFKDNIEEMLEYRPNKEGDRVLMPHLDNKLLVFIEDLHMTMTDSYGDQPAIESLRDYFTQGAWLCSRKRKWRHLQDVSFFSTLSQNAPEADFVTARVLHHFNVIVRENPTVESIKHVYSNLTNIMINEWPSKMHPFSSRISNATVDMVDRVMRYLKPTPMKAQYCFSWRDVGKILLGMQMIESNSLKAQEDVMKLFYHECYRTMGDRMLMTHDRKWFLAELEKVCRKHFYIVEELEEIQSPTRLRDDGTKEELDPARLQQFLWPVDDPDKLWYSNLNGQVDGFYMEVEKIKIDLEAIKEMRERDKPAKSTIRDGDKVEVVIRSFLERYNDSNERVRLDLMLYNQLNRQLLKILRVITCPGGHLINVAMKGFGMNSIMKLACFIAQQQLHEPENYEGIQIDEWQGKLKQTILQAITEDKQVTFFVDQYKMVYEQQWEDLVSLIKNNQVTQITNKSDIMLSLGAIYETFEKEKAAKRAAKPEAEAEMTEAEKQHRQEVESEISHDYKEDAKKMLVKHPDIHAQCYQTLLQRVRANFHLVLQMTPTGGHFRERIVKHKELLYHCQMAFMTDLPAPELESLSDSFIELEKEQQKRKASAKFMSNANPYSMNGDQEETNRVKSSIVRMFLQAQEMTRKFQDDVGQVLYLTPVHFVQVFVTYRKLLKQRQELVAETSGKYEDGLEKIRRKQQELYDYHKRLEERAPALYERQRQLMRVINEIQEQIELLQAERDQLKREEFEAEQATEAAEKVLADCKESLDRMLPSLKEALQLISELTKKDIAELKSLHHPPKVVKLVVTAVCMIMNIPPEEKLSRKTGRPKLSYWKAAQGPKVLGNPSFPRELQEFKREEVTPETMLEVEEVLNAEGYTHDRAKNACVAASSLFKWVNATREYFYIYKEIEPSRNNFKLAQDQFEAKKLILEQKRQKISNMDKKIATLQEHQKSKDDIIDEIKAEIEELSLRKKRADTLLKGLSAEKQKWVVCTRMLSSKYSTVAGDVLVSAGYISLITGFDQKHRTKLINRWARGLIEYGFTVSKQFELTELFGNTHEISKWHSNGLPSDNMSVNNALTANKTKRFSLLIDPQMQGVHWVKNHYDDGGSLTVLRENDSQFKKQVELAFDLGRTVVVEGIGSKVNLNLLSLMRKEVTKYAGKRRITFCRKQYQYDKNFRLFVVCSEPEPHFDVNVTNHVCVLNFSVNLESLQSQMLDLVIRNERKDLEDGFAESKNAAFESIRSLRGIEGAILSALEADVHALLGEESLIGTLGESQSVAEFTASRLRSMTQTNQFIQRSRELYAPVAFRCAILYFVVRDLSKINAMYKFSLQWFKDLVMKSLELTNQMKDDSSKESNEEDAALKVMSGKGLSVDDRVQLLSKTITQELYKRLQIALFEEDRQLTMYLIAARVQEAENFLQRDLFNFLLNGSKEIKKNSIVPPDLNEAKLPGLNNMAWANLQYLAKLKPFNEKNLLGHIVNHPKMWKEFCAFQDGLLTFNDMPNARELDLRFFTMMDQAEFQEQAVNPNPNMSIVDEGKADGTQSEKPRRDVNSQLGARTQNDSNSRAGSRGLKRTESEILADPDIWNVGDSSDSDADLVSAGQEKAEKDPMDVLGSVSGDDTREDSAEIDQVEMARYLIDTAPSLKKGSGNDYMDTLRKKTSSERQLILRRENALKNLCELAILKCLRPDLLVGALNRFAANIVDKEYYDFKEDILVPYTTGKKKRGEMTAQEMATRMLGDKVMHATNQSKNSISGKQMSGSESKEGSVVQGSQAAEPQRSQQTTSSQRQAQQMEKQRQERELRQKKGGLNNVKNLVKEAYEDSHCRAPIYLMVNSSLNVYDMVNDFCMKKTAGSNVRLWHSPLGKGIEEEVEGNLQKAAQNGDWILLENLHLVEDWLPTLDEKLSKMKGNELNNRFRIWISSIPMANCPQSLLEKSIKVALTAPRSIKKKMEVMLYEQEKEQFFRKTGKASHVHKNIFFSLCYLHSLMTGRVQYGPIGWQKPYKFDMSDFEISLVQCNQQFRNFSTSMSNSANIVTEFKNIIEILRFYYLNINYAGKLQRTDDQVILEAIVEDLFNDDTLLDEEQREANMELSHYGYPPEYQTMDYMAWHDRHIPEEDSPEIFGFNANIQRDFFIKQANHQIDLLVKYDKVKDPALREPLTNVDMSIEMSSLKTSLNSSGTATQSAISAMLADEGSILNLFCNLQKILASSSLDNSATDTSFRFDQLVDQDHLAKRDQNDQRVAEIAQKLLERLQFDFDMEAIEQKFPVMYKAPLNNVVNRELLSYKVLVKSIVDSVADLLANIDGKYPRPYEVEDLWSKVQINRVPDKWLKVSFETSVTSLADYIVELQLKLDFWRKVVDTDLANMPSIWLPAFFDPKSFLAGLIQTRARIEAITMKDLYNEYTVTETYENEEPKEDEQHVVYIHGLHLEGACWDVLKKEIVEITDRRRFVPFPCIRIATRTHAEARAEWEKKNVNWRTKNRKGKSSKEIVDDGPTGAEAANPIMPYRCPLFKCTHRLSKGLVASDKVAVEYINLDTRDEPRKWIKRGVALLMEIDRADSV